MKMRSNYTVCRILTYQVQIQSSVCAYTLSSWNFAESNSEWCLRDICTKARMQRLFAYSNDALRALTLGQVRRSAYDDKCYTILFLQKEENVFSSQRLATAAIFNLSRQRNWSSKYVDFLNCSNF